MLIRRKRMTNNFLKSRHYTENGADEDLGKDQMKCKLL
jgi:hypothetical protein